MSTPNRPLRVVHVINALANSGGAERFAEGLASNLPRDRFVCWMCATRWVDDAVASRLADAGVRHLNLGRKAKWDVHRLGGLLGLLRAQHIDVVHAHMFGSNLWGTLFGRVAGVPVMIAHEHNWSYDGSEWRKWIDGKVIGRLVTRFIAVSEANRDRMVELEGVPADKVLVMPTAYVPHAGSSHGDLRAELGLGAQALLVGVAAELRKEKALDVLIQAHAHVASEVSDAHLVIAGDGVCRPQLERLIDDLGLRRSVHMLGFRTDVDSILRSVDVGVMSSDWEGMPLFVFECMATNTPLVATAVGGLPEIIEHDKTGILVPPRDPVALGHAITRLLGDFELRRRLSAAATTRLDQYRIEAVAGRFASLYETLWAESQRASANGHRPSA